MMRSGWHALKEVRVNKIKKGRWSKIFGKHFENSRIPNFYVPFFLKKNIFSYGFSDCKMLCQKVVINCDRQRSLIRELSDEIKATYAHPSAQIIKLWIWFLLLSVLLHFSTQFVLHFLINFFLNIPTKFQKLNQVKKMRFVIIASLIGIALCAVHEHKLTWRPSR